MLLEKDKKLIQTISYFFTFYNIYLKIESNGYRSNFNFYIV